MTVALISPSGCRWCGVEYRAPHAQRWANDVGWHVWAEPTDGQRLQRMLARRKDRLATEARGESEPAVSDEIRRAVTHYRATGRPVDNAVAELLARCALWADGMRDPDDWESCDEPSSTQLALAVARALPPKEEM